MGHINGYKTRDMSSLQKFIIQLGSCHRRSSRTLRVARDPPEETHGMVNLMEPLPVLVLTRDMITYFEQRGVYKFIRQVERTGSFVRSHYDARKEQSTRTFKKLHTEEHVKWWYSRLNIPNEIP
jgi:hypothetical protein